MNEYSFEKLESAITAGRAALANAESETNKPFQPDWVNYRQGYENGEAEALEQNGEPVAYITETEKGDMVWTPDMYGEACTYCDDGEFPVPLYKSAEPIKQPQVTFWSPSSSAKQATHYPNTKE